MTVALVFQFGNRNMTKNPRNLVGPHIRRLRDQQGLTQPMLAARGRRGGGEVSRQTPAKIETQLVSHAPCVVDVSVERGLVAVVEEVAG